MDEKILNNLTILYVEDNKSIKDNTIITLQLLNMNIIDAENGEEGLEKFKQHSDEIEVILTDISMPIMNGLEMVEEIKKIRSDIPIIVTTAHQEISYLKKAIELGVTSYILKPIKIHSIIDSVVKAMEPINLKRELIQKNEELTALNNSLEEKIKIRTAELEKLASTDFLTGVNNRRNFFKLAKEQFEQNDDLYAVMIDVDKFKEINDTHGHQIGDEILILLTKTLMKELDENDIFGRVGGEEFALVCKCDDNKHIEKLEHLRATVEKLKHNEVAFTISLGVSKKHPEDENIDKLLSRADAALYEAKGTGRNKIIFRA